MMLWKCLALASCFGLSFANTNLMDTSNDVKNQVAEYRTFCYSCSSESVMCQKAVYDGQYLTTVPCKSMCFLRQENNVTYRGCFDGWLGGLVRNDYLGCKKQIYYGRQVEWCFCKDAVHRQGEPCNGAPRLALADNTRDVYDPIYTNYYQDPVELNNLELKSSVGYNAENHGSRGPEPKMADYQNEIEEYAFINELTDQPDSAESIRTCKDKSDGSYRDPSDCNRYYLCSNGYAYRMRCPKGTQWNQAMGSCAFAFHMQYPCKGGSGSDAAMLTTSYGGNYGGPQVVEAYGGKDYDVQQSIAQPAIANQPIAYSDDVYEKQMDVASFGNSYGLKAPVLSYESNSFEQHPDMTSYGAKYDNNKGPIGNYKQAPIMSSYGGSYDTQSAMTSFGGNYDKQPAMGQMKPNAFPNHLMAVPQEAGYDKQPSIRPYSQKYNKNPQRIASFAKQSPERSMVIGKYRKQAVIKKMFGENVLDAKQQQLKNGGAKPIREPNNMDNFYQYNY